MTPSRQLIGPDVTLTSRLLTYVAADWSRNYVAYLGCFNLNDRIRAVFRTVGAPVRVQMWGPSHGGGVWFYGEFCYILYKEKQL